MADIKKTAKPEAPVEQALTTSFVPSEDLREATLDGTDLKAWHALRGAGMMEHEVSRAINALRDHGITFAGGEDG